MPAKKFLRLVNNRIREVLGIVVSAGAANAGDVAVLDDTGKFDISVMPTGIGPAVTSFVTSENLSAGNVVNIYDNAGTPTARKANATSEGKEAIGFVLAATTSPNPASVYFTGTLSGLSSLTVGARYFISTTGGAVTATPPTASGNVSQCIGTAISTTEIAFNIEDPITKK